MPKEVGGSLSTFGDQILSTKATQPRTRIGTSGRTDKVYHKAYETEKLGRTSEGVTTNAISSFGPQPQSKKSTIPAFKFEKSQRQFVCRLDKDAPGPGSYDTFTSIGKQPLAHKQTVPAWKQGQSQRFVQMKGPGDDATLANTREVSPKLGDAPKVSFHGKGKRSNLCQNKDTEYNPGPGSYPAISSFGHQVEARKQSVPRPKIGTETREGIMKLYLSPEQERVLLARSSPSPIAYNNAVSSIGPQVISKRANPSGTKFGTSDRFSDIKPRTGRDILYTNTLPGPGSYTI